jgi:alkanesulfonate monooxygenase SsuD/methylene tetrahydromethanopterin reductase-like flavin-dependent oxidoreductase (luciferase family)
VPIGNRRDVVRVAEELAMVDCISHGRLEAGFIRGVSTEILPANASPVGSAERFWEAHDLILKAWTSHDGPFNFEGKYHQYRQVNIWPRPYQQPTPPVWITSTSPDSVRRVAEHGYVLGTIVGGAERTRQLFGTYREHCALLGRAAPDPDRFGYAAFVYVGQTDEEGKAGAEKLRWMLDTYKIPPHLSAPPGFSGLGAAVSALRGAHRPWTGPSHGLAYKTVDELIDRGVMFAGNPESVVKQLTRFNDQVGGFGNLMMIGQAGFMTHEETVSNLELFAQDVYPALKALTPAGSMAAVA